METQKRSTLGVLCLVIALLMILFLDIRAFLATGFLYYAYKLLYKKEQASRTDRVVIMFLIFVLTIYLVLAVYFSVGYLSELQNQTSL
jgi:hypothetical protein